MIPSDESMQRAIDAAGIHWSPLPARQADSPLGRSIRAHAAALDQIERTKYDGIHTCHAQCQRPACVARRQRDIGMAALTRISEGQYEWPVGPAAEALAALDEIRRMGE